MEKIPDNLIEVDDYGPDIMKFSSSLCLRVSSKADVFNHELSLHRTDHEPEGVTILHSAAFAFLVTTALLG